MHPLRLICLADVLAALKRGELEQAITITQNLCANAIATARVEGWLPNQRDPRRTSCSRGA
jgi:hypothetical protein